MQDSLTIDDALWERLIELTAGSAALCYQCGVCTAACPWGEVRQEHLSVRTLMRQAQLGLSYGGDDLWLCTTCAQCEAYCPRGVAISDVFRALRLIAWEQRAVAAGLPTLLWSVYWNENPWSQPPSQRAAWANDLAIPKFDPTAHDLLFYAGCTASFDRRAQQIARALVKLLRAAGVRFGYLAEEEPCCGEAALSVGHIPNFQEIAAKTAHIFREHNVRRLVTVSPHCYDVFRNHYPQTELGVDFTPLHYTQYLVDLINKGRLQFNQPLGRRIAFQDPCYLGRHNGEYRAPRRLLESIPAVELLEMPLHGKESLCCGGGGGRMWLETPAGERFADRRVQQALDIEADTLVTACPFCLVCLEDSQKQLKNGHMQVLDVAEILVQAL